MDTTLNHLQIKLMPDTNPFQQFVINNNEEIYNKIQLVKYEKGDLFFAKNKTDVKIIYIIQGELINVSKSFNFI